MKLIAFLAGCLISAPLCAVEQEGLTLRLTQEEDDACTEGGGCYLVPKAELHKALEGYAKRAYEAGAKSCQGRDRL